jgi:hypothetical protein
MRKSREKSKILVKKASIYSETGRNSVENSRFTPEIGAISEVFEVI